MELPDASYSFSDIRDYIEYIIKRHETLITIPPIHVCTEKLIDKSKNGENVPSLEVAKVVLVQCNLVDNQYQQMPEVLYTFTPIKSYAYLLNVEPNNFVFLKNYNTEFDKIIVTFTDEDGRPLGTEDKVNSALLLINRNDTLFELSHAKISDRIKEKKIC